MSTIAGVFTRQFFHGTRADLEPGDTIRVGYPSNFTTGKPLSWVCLLYTSPSPRD